MDRDAAPTIRPQAVKSANPADGLIPIIPGPKTAAVQGPKVSKQQYWLDFYRKHDESPAALQEKVAILNVNKKFDDVRCILFAYLKLHNNNSEPWMYEAYALALKMNNASPADVKMALGYAADLAIKSRNPNFLVSVADMMLYNGIYLERAGELLDKAADLIPHRGEPLAMSINLAQKTKDPKRMGDSIERLLALGWPELGVPGRDEAIRHDARKAAETLAKTLREDGRDQEAETLLTRLTEAEARDLFIRLTWVGDAGLDLAVDEPLGATAKYITPRTVFGGSIIKDGYGKHPEEVYVCPQGFDGEYTVRIETTYNNPEKPALKATLEIITHEGTPEEHKETRTVTLGGPKPPEPVTVSLIGGRRKKALPFLAPTRTAPPELVGPPDRARRRPVAGNTPVALPETKGRASAIPIR